MSEEARDLAKRVLSFYPDIERMTEDLYDSLGHPEASFAWIDGESREMVEKSMIRLVLEELVVKSERRTSDLQKLLQFIRGEGHHWGPGITHRHYETDKIVVWMPREAV